MRGRGKSLDALDGTRHAAPARSSRSASRSRSASATPSGARASIVGDEPFAVLLPDDLMVGRAGGTGCLAQMVEAYETGRRQRRLRRGSAGRADRTATESSRPATTRRQADRGQGPGREAEAGGGAVAARMLVGRYILQPEVMRVLDNPVRGAGGEIQLTDAMAALIGTPAFPRPHRRRRALRLRRQDRLRHRQPRSGAEARRCRAGAFAPSSPDCA